MEDGDGIRHLIFDNHRSEVFRDMISSSEEQNLVLDLLNRYNISGIPVIILFKNGEIVKQWEGYTEKGDLESEINKIK